MNNNFVKATIFCIKIDRCNVLKLVYDGDKSLDSSG